MTPDEHNHLPQLHAYADIASYLTVTGDIPLPQFDAFLAEYRRTYLPPKKKNKQLRLVVEAAAAQEQQQLGGLNKEAGGLQKDFYATALEDHRLKHNEKLPTAAQAFKLWEAAAQSAHEFLVRQQAKDQPNPEFEEAPSTGRRQSKRQKRTNVPGIGFLFLP